ncbi:L,D-transpeptidase [Streptomyces sp. NPDC050504]|uniref:L,D-transpeptidase n=1 Tax=Streptomyces sp. NPDC050504 TaxID=3365618 RepID=UPI0037969A9F
MATLGIRTAMGTVVLGALLASGIPAAVADESVPRNGTVRSETARSETARTLPERPGAPERPAPKPKKKPARPAKAGLKKKPKKKPVRPAKAKHNTKPKPKKKRPAACTASTGPYQWDLEKRLKLKQDGRMSPADCVAIRKLQKRLHISPANGYPDLKTYRLMLVDDVRKNPNARKRCPVRRYRVTCVDLTRQILWVQKGKKVVFSPVPIRSGRKGLETRTGWQRVYQKKRTFFSTIYDGAPMPYSQFFNGGQALHGTYKDLFKSGSGGCVNMYVKDAKRLFKLLEVGDRLYIHGRKPTRALVTGDPYAEQDKRDDALIAEAFGQNEIPVTWDLDTPLNAK